MQQAAQISVYIVIPMYNSARYIERLFKSLEHQTIANEMLVIAVDDGSEDNTYKLASAYKPQNYLKITLAKEHSGLSDTRNLGIDWIQDNARIDCAERSFIMFLDSDDSLENNALEKLKNAAVTYDTDILFFTASLCYEDEEARAQFQERYENYYRRNERYTGAYCGPEYLVKAYEHDDFKPSPAMQFSRLSHVLSNNLRFYPGILHEDNLYTLTSTCLARKVRYIDEKLYIRSIHSNSIMTRPASWRNAYGYFKNAQEAWRFIKEHESFLNERELNAFASIVDGWLEAATDYFCALEEAQINQLIHALTDFEQAIFKSTVQNRAEMRYEKNREIEAAQAGAYTQCYANAKNEVEERFSNSVSYRLGRAITFLPRKILHR